MSTILDDGRMVVPLQGGGAESPMGNRGQEIKKKELRGMSYCFVIYVFRFVFGFLLTNRQSLFY